MIDEAISMVTNNFKDVIKECVPQERIGRRVFYDYPEEINHFFKERIRFLPVYPYARVYGL